MATTPPPPRRVHTPPTPLHGPKYDSYEPYSPRRSSRVAAQRRTIEQLPAAVVSPSKQRRVRATTPTNAPRTSARGSSQTFSPPSSPASPVMGTPRAKGKAKSRFGMPSASVLSRADADPFGGEPSHDLEPTLLDPRAMLPTPSKTPRKRAVQQSSISSTARVLFPGRTATVEDAMPDPKKLRRAKKNAFSLASFEAMHGEEGENSNIPIYTDSKERVPNHDDDEENPFISKKETKTRSPRSTRKLSKDDKASKMEQAMRNDEGVIVTFRGKKIFRKFDDDVAADAAEEDTWSDLEIRRKAGSSSKERPFLRSSYKPRLLFPTEEQRRAREAEADEADEEALTDIEVPIPQSSSRMAAVASTPVKQPFRSITPPSTVRKTRGSTKKALDFNALPLNLEPDVDQPMEDDQISVTSSKKNSPFDTWRRVKSAAPVSATTSKSVSKKREGALIDDAAEGLAPKRTKNTAS